MVTSDQSNHTLLMPGQEYCKTSMHYGESL